MPSVTTYRKERGVIIVPLKKYTPKWTIEIGDTDVSDYLINATVDLPITSRAWSSNLTLANPRGLYTKEFEKGDIVKIYADFSNGTTKIFEGRLETLHYKLDLTSGFTVPIFTRGYGADALERKVTEQYDEADTIPNIFIYLRNKYLPNHSSDNTYIDTSITTTYLPSWSEKPLWECFVDLVEKAGNHHFYCDNDKKWHLFEKGSVTCTKETMVYGDNIIEMDIVEDMLPLGTRVTVYGRELESIPTVKTVKDTSVEAIYNVIRERSFSLGELLTMEQVRDKANSLLSKLKTLEQTGSGSSVGLPNLNPGERLLVINPYCNVSGFRLIASLTHVIDSGGFKTNVQFAEEEKGLTAIIKDRIKSEQETPVIKNRYSMEDAHIIVFDDEDESEIESKDKTLVWDGHLILEAGQTSGYAITETYVASKNISQGVVKVSGENLAGSEGETWVSLQVSVDNGVTWEDTEKDELHTFSATGKRLKIKVTITSLTTRIKALGVLFK